MDIRRIDRDDPLLAAARIALGDDFPASISALGNLELLSRRPLALFSSVKCPGSLILQTYDLAQVLRQGDMAVVGGFHSPMERVCLNILLRGPQPVIVCPARSIEGIRLPAGYRKPLEEGRLLLLSPFAAKQRRATVDTALDRNRFVAALAHSIFVAHAAPAGKMEQLCHEILAWGKPLYTLEADANANLLALGAKPLRPRDALSVLYSLSI